MINKPIGSAAIAAAKKSGHINIVDSNNKGAMVEVMDLSETSREAQQKHSETLKKFEAIQRARSIIVPTDIEEVKWKLRELGHPITFFGEGPADRRERLKQVIAELELSSDELKTFQVIN